MCTCWVGVWLFLHLSTTVYIVSVAAHVCIAHFAHLTHALLLHSSLSPALLTSPIPHTCCCTATSPPAGPFSQLLRTSYQPWSSTPAWAAVRSTQSITSACSLCPFHTCAVAAQQPLPQLDSSLSSSALPPSRSHQHLRGLLCDLHSL